MSAAGPFRIGVVAPLSGPQEIVGRGIVDSMKSYLRWNASEVLPRRSAIELVESDDRGDPSLTRGAVDRCLAAGAVAVVGPSSSTCAAEILSDPAYGKVPFLLSFATRSNIVSAGSGNAFRVTTPDVRRVSLLLRFIKQTQQTSDLTVFVLDDHPSSYAMGLADDVRTVAAQLGMQVVVRPFTLANATLPGDVDRHPVLICAPSRESMWLIGELRKRRIGSAIFSFGSNKNYLKHAAVGVTNVCDINYRDHNPIVQEYLRQILGAEESEREASLSSILAVHILTQALNSVEQTGRSIAQQRTKLISVLRRDAFQGPFGDVAFSDTGELIGHEQISLVTVKRRGFSVYFGPPEVSRYWGLTSRQRVWAMIWEIIIVVSTVGGAVGLAQLIVQLFAAYAPK